MAQSRSSSLIFSCLTYIGIPVGARQKLLLEEAAEGAAHGEAGGGGHLVDAHFGMGGQQFAGMVETQPVDVVDDAGVLAVLGKGRADAQYLIALIAESSSKTLQRYNFFLNNHTQHIKLLLLSNFISKKVLVVCNIFIIFAP